MSESAIAAALAVARGQGVRCDEPVVLRDAWHVLVHLRPSPVVARVSSSIPFPEGPDPGGIERELVVAAHAARAGAPVIPPAEEVEQVPHRYRGHVVTFWRYVPPHAEADPRAAGRALRAVHDALADYDADLPEPGHPEETLALLGALGASAETEFLRGLVAASPKLLDGQALHGDAHLLNCLGSPGGPLWHDFETACSGPREYDLAALVARHLALGDTPEAYEALSAYGAHDADVLDAMLPLYVAWVTASMMVASRRRPELDEAVDVRLRWLRDR